MGARGFVIQATVRENVLELMRALGPYGGSLSLRAFAKQIAERHPTKKIDFKAVRRWTRVLEPVEPDIASIAIMADLAGVPFEQFALGKGATVRTVGGNPGVQLAVSEAAGDTEPATIAEEPDVDPAPARRGAAKATKHRKVVP